MNNCERFGVTEEQLRALVAEINSYFQFLIKLIVIFTANLRKFHFSLQENRQILSEMVEMASFVIFVAQVQVKLNSTIGNNFLTIDKNFYRKNKNSIKVLLHQPRQKYLQGLPLNRLMLLSYMQN